MAHFGKTFFLSLILTGIIYLALKTSIPLALTGMLFLVVSFLSSLASGAQSFTLSRLSFLFINGFIFFLAVLHGSGGLADYLFLILAFIAINAIFGVTSHFSFLHKNLPNITKEDYPQYSKNYFGARNLIFSFLYLTAFIWYANAFIIYSVLGLPFYVSLLIIFFITLNLTSFLFNILRASSGGEKIIFPISMYSWIMGLIVCQISWVVGFWPFGYLTAAFIITIIYYTVAMILKEYIFSSAFTRTFVLREMIFTGVIIVLIFYFTNWLPL